MNGSGSAYVRGNDITCLVWGTSPFTREEGSGIKYGGWTVSEVQSLFFWRVTSLRMGVVTTGGGTFLLDNTTLCGGGVRFDLEEGV